jgi:hypothetical protein
MGTVQVCLTDSEEYLSPGSRFEKREVVKDRCCCVHLMNYLEGLFHRTPLEDEVK